jgi:hypothetical protein
MIKPASHTGRRTVLMPRTQLDPLACDPAATGSRRSAPTCLAFLVGAVLLSTIAACGGSGVDAQTGPPPSSTPASSSPTRASTPRQLAVTAAIAQVDRYERVLDDLAIHPTLRLDRLYTVSTEPAVLSQIAFFNRFRSARDRQSGGTRIVSIRVRRVSLAHQTTARPAQRPTIDVTACLDVAQVKAFGPGGQSIVPKSRKPYYLTHLQLVNVKYPDPSSWLVAKVSATEEQRSCAS